MPSCFYDPLVTFFPFSLHLEELLRVLFPVHTKGGLIMNFTQSQRIFRSILSLSIIMLIIGCGGGGSSSNGSGGGESIPDLYSGLTSQALITDKNSKDLMEGAFTGGQAGSPISVLGSVQVQPSNNSRHPVTIAFPRMIIHSFKKGDFSFGPAVPALASAVSMNLNETVDGECGGSYIISADINELTGAISSGTMEFVDYCDAGVTESGTVLFSGQIDLTTEEGNLEFTFDDFTFTENGNTGSIKGTASYAVGISTETMTFKDIYFRDNSLNKTYWFHNYVEVMTDESSSYTMTIDGRYYDPDYGYIEYSTEKAFTILSEDENPSDGVLIALGRDNTKARLTAHSSATYSIETDTNGDGMYEWNSGTLYW
jgi:hypothetical protein